MSAAPYFDVRHEGRYLITRWDVIVRTEPFNGWTVPRGWGPYYTRRNADVALISARQDWASAKLSETTSVVTLSPHDADMLRVRGAVVAMLDRSLRTRLTVRSCKSGADL